jgi:hypothetical protein
MVWKGNPLELISEIPAVYYIVEYRGREISHSCNIQGIWRY